MDIIVPILVGLIFLVIPILIIGGVVYFILRIRSGVSIRFSYRIALRVYLYVVILISIGLGGLGGVSTLLNVGFGEVFGREFSYGNVYEKHRDSQDRERGNNNPSHTGNEHHSLPEKVELEIKGRLINGVSLAAIGLFLLLTHLLSRWWIETDSERSDSLRKLYLIAGLVVFSIVTIVSLATGIPETLRYALLDVVPGEESPGEPLSIAIIAVPAWIYYLVVTLRGVRCSSIKSNP